MSQAGIISTTAGPVPPQVPTSFETDVNSPAIPVANQLDVFGGTITTNNANGIQTDGSSGGDTLTIQLTNRLQGAATTVGATTADLVTFVLPATPGSYALSLQAAGFNPSTPASTAFFDSALVRTSGVAATIVGIPDETFIEDPALAASDIDFVTSGNSIIIRATGVAGLTIDWTVTGSYTFAG